MDGLDGLGDIGGQGNAATKSKQIKNLGLFLRVSKEGSGVKGCGGDDGAKVRLWNGALIAVIRGH